MAQSANVILCPGQPQAASESVSILLVDDDEVDRLAVLRALRQANLTADFVEVADAEAAVSQLRRPFDCILLDLQLPGKKDGFDVLLAARAAGVETPIVILTGHGDEETAVKIMKAGAADYIPKANLSPERLANSISHAIRVFRAERDLKMAQAALAESQARLHLALDAARLGMWHCDLPLAELVWDARCKAQFGIAPDTRVTVELFDSLIHPDDRKRTRAAIDGAIAERTSYDVEFRTSTAEARWIRAMGKASYDPSGAPTRLDGVTMDVSDLKRIEELRERLLAIVGHDLRTPLSAITMAAAMQVRRGALSESDAKATDRIVRSADRMARMITQLLDFTKARLGGGLTLERSSCDLAELCKEVLEELRQAYPARTIVLRHAGDARAFVDSVRACQVIANLVGNALQHGAPESPVEVSVRGDGDRIVLAVRNDGPPIPESIVRVLFDPFRRGADSNARTERLGLGLYITHEIVKSHGGRIDVRSSEADGTTFTATFPRVPE